MANSKFQKLINSYSLLQQLRFGPVGRTALGKILDLQPSTVFASIDRLKELNLVIETNQMIDNPKAGRPGRCIAINPKAGVVFGLDLNVDGFYYSIRALNGDVIFEGQESFLDDKFDVSENSNERLQQCLAHSINYIERKCIKEKILGGCIGVPGIVKPNGKVIQKSWAWGVSSSDLSELLETRYYPLYLENDANCGALNYLESEHDCFLYLLLRRYNNKGEPGPLPSLYLGSGVIIDGRLRRGYGSRAGEFHSGILHCKKKEESSCSEDMDHFQGQRDLFLQETINSLVFANGLLDPRKIFLVGDIDIWNEALQKVKDDYHNLEEEFNKLKILKNTKMDIAQGACKLMFDFLFHVPFLNDNPNCWDRNPSILLEGLE